MTAHAIPAEALDKHVALLGMTGAGKTSVIKAAIVEPDLDEDRRVLIVTPKDDWWGLRLSRSGKSKGYDIPIFGGRHADYPLQVKDAALLAEAYGTMKGSAIFCTSLLSVQDRARWFAQFAETFLNKNKGWVRLVIDEAHIFMPKQGGKGGGAIPAALHAGNELVSQGRSPGIRIVLASQRSAKLHNDALTQCSCLVAMLLMAPHDRDAVKDWIEDQADPVKGKEIIASLANLRPGQAWVWAPRAHMLQKIQFPLPATFDSSAAPDDDSADAVTLKPINLDALKGKLATVEATKKANDPKELQAEIAKLRAENNRLSQAGTTAQAALLQKKPDKDALAAAQQKGFEQAKKKLATAAEREIATAFRRIIKGVKDKAATLFDELLHEIGEARVALPDLELDLNVTFEPDAPAPAPAAPRAVRPVQQKPVLVQRPAAAPAAGGDTALTNPQRQLLQSLAWWAAMGHDTPTRTQVAAIAQWKPKGSNLRNRLTELSTGGLVVYPREGLVQLTAAGVAAAPTPDTSATLVQSIRAICTKPMLQVFDALLAFREAGQTEVTRDELATQMGWEPGGSNLRNRLTELSQIEAVTYPSKGSVALQEWVVEDVRAAA